MKLAFMIYSIVKYQISLFLMFFSVWQITTITIGQSEILTEYLVYGRMFSCRWIDIFCIKRDVVKMEPIRYTKSKLFESMPKVH